MIDPRIKDKWWRINHLYKIIDKQGNLTTFKCNQEQTELFNSYQSKTALRELILKARQIGFTTFHCIYYLDEILFHRNRRAVIIAHHRDTLEKIFRIVKVAYENIPEVFKLKAKMDTKNELWFEDSNSSIAISLRVRGGTVHHLHISEKAYINDDKELKAGSYQAVPNTGDITVETTANGVGNHFHKDWQAAKDNSIFSPNFFSWLDHEEYTSDKDTQPCPHEDYLDAIGASDRQRNWWRLKWSEFGKDFDLMLQEYPARAEDAFISSGRQVFPHITFDTKEPRRVDMYSDKSIDIIIDPVSGKEIDIEVAKKNGIEVSSDIVWELEDNPKSPIRLWKEPEEGHIYTIGADVAEGLAKGDYSCAYVVDIETFEVVAKWHGHIDPELFGLELVKLARYYNNAEIAPESNNHGIATINKIKSIYDNIYFTEKYDEIADRYTNKLGWHTNLKTKPLMIAELRDVLRDHSLKVYDDKLLDEIRTYVYGENGSTNATEGCYDDMVIALAIAVQARKAIL